MISRIAKTAILATAFAGFIAFQATASTFSAWQISGVPYGDTLNIRKYPSSKSQKQSAYPNGTVLQMTGKCTGDINLFDISGYSKAKQKQIVRYVWCQVWHDPSQNGHFVTGWAYGKYIAPY